jgi:hypothetical protein
VFAQTDTDRFLAMTVCDVLAVPCNVCALLFDVKENVIRHTPHDWMN